MVINRGDRVPPDFTLHGNTWKEHSRFEKVVNFTDHQGRWVSLVEPSIGPGPAHIVLDSLRFLDFDLRTIAVFDSLAVFQPLKVSTRTLENWLLETATEESLSFLIRGENETSKSKFRETLKKEFYLAKQLLFKGDISASVNKIWNLGIGFTPSGCDFVFGIVAAARFLDEPWRSRILKCQVPVQDLSFAAQQVRFARDGHFTANWKNFLEALGRGEGDARGYFNQVLAHGATSGADSLTGFILGLTLQTCLLETH